MNSPSRNLYNCKHRCLCILLQYCWCIFVYVFKIFLCATVCYCIRITIICKQVCTLHCFVLVVFLYNFIVKHYKTKIPISRFPHFYKDIFRIECYLLATPLPYAFIYFYTIYLVRERSRCKCIVNDLYTCSGNTVIILISCWPLLANVSGHFNEQLQFVEHVC